MKKGILKNEVIVMLSGKGGVGKSATARELACRLEDSFLLDTDTFNGVHAEWFDDKSKSALLDPNGELKISDKSKLPRYMIIDTKGGFDDIRLRGAIPKGDIFIIPITPTAGSTKGFKNTLLKLDEVLASEKNENKKIVIVINDVKPLKEMTLEYREIIDGILTSIKSLIPKLSNIKKEWIRITTIEHHDVVGKSENFRVSIADLRKKYLEENKKSYYEGIDRDFNELVKIIKGEKK